MREGGNFSLRVADDSEESVIVQDPGSSLLFFFEGEKYQETLFFVGFLTMIAFLLMLFNETFLHKVARKVPESVMLIVLGIAFAAIGNAMHLFNVIHDKITAGIFFNFLLPPIILDAAYQLYCKQFLFNLDGVILMAVLGTTLNIFAIGLSLWRTWGVYHDKSLLKCLLFAAIVSAVDPVAVLAVFNQIGVQRGLYFLIFGESLLNDGVTVVVFDTLEKIAFVEKIKGSTYAYAVLSFFPVAFGGAFIGIVWGVLSSLACKYTSVQSKILEPTLIILSAYMAFLNAQLFHWSGIMALIGCGLVQKRYGFENLHEKSKVTIELGVGILATIAETIIFLILGFEVLDGTIEWDFWLISLSLTFCLVYRYLFTFSIGMAINTFRLHKLSFNHMFMISYGGLRGAVSYAMAVSLHEDDIKNVFMGATLAVILGTVMLQGTTIKFLVALMKFKEPSHSDNFTSNTIKKINFHVLAGMETILGGGGSTIHYWLEKFERFDKRHIQPFLCKKGSEEKRLAVLLKNQGKVQQEIQNHVLWGSQDYAVKRIAARKQSRPSASSPAQGLRSKQEKSKAIGKFKKAVNEKKTEAEDSSFIADDKLDRAWKKKLEVIRNMRQQAGQESQNDRATQRMQLTKAMPPRRRRNTLRVSNRKKGEMRARGPFSERKSVLPTITPPPSQKIDNINKEHQAYLTVLD